MSVHGSSEFGPVEGAPEVGPEAELFANALDDCLAPQGTPKQQRDRIFKLIDIYYSHAADKLNQLRGLSSKGYAGTEMDVDDDEIQVPASDSEVRKWSNEAQTWDLIRRLAPLRYMDEKTQGNPKRPTTGSSDGEDLWGTYIGQGGQVLERKRVLEWLQHSACVGPDIDELVRDLQQNAERGEIIAHGWIHTRTAVKLHKELVGVSRALDPSSPDVTRNLITTTGAPLVSQLDPDAVTRQSRKLQPQDEYFERSIWVGCYQLLRRGRSLEEIREWCTERTEVWRAVSMSALPLALEGDAACPRDQAITLALWRRMCFATARQGGADEFERAVYGILSGDIQSVEKVCKSWDDLLFMHYNALLRCQFDDFVLGLCPPEVSANLCQSFPVFDAVQFHGDPGTTERRLLHSLSMEHSTCHEAAEPSKVLQAAVISNELSQHFVQQGLSLAREQEILLAVDGNGTGINNFLISAKDFDGLRVTVHMFILLSALDNLSPARPQFRILDSDPSRRGSQEAIIGAYVTLLRLANYEELIPLYCSRMLPDRAYETLSRNLHYIIDRESRLNLLDLIQKAGLDVARFVKTQPQLIFSKIDRPGGIMADPTAQFRIIDQSPPSLKFGRLIKTDFFGEDPDTIEENDEALIRSLEWLILVEETWTDAFQVGVSIYKYFLGTMRLNAARQLANRVPVSSILRLRIQSTEDQDEADAFWLPDEEDGFWASQIEASSLARLSSRQLATQARTFRDLECLVKALDAMETIASLTELSREESTATRDFWSRVGTEVKTARECVMPLFNGWLEASGTTTDLEKIRHAYLPETILAYVSTLHFAGTSLSRDHLLECMDLAAVIAQKGSGVASSFVKGNRMKELVESFAACSKALAIVTGEKKSAGSNSKRMREMGWSRDLWSVKP